MPKLRLELDELRVETFDPAPGEPRGTGTVYGADVTPGCPPSVNPCVTRDTACLTRECPTRAC